MNKPAFPQNDYSAYTDDRDGMSLRDWFAGQALCGLSGHISGAKVIGRETQAQAEARWSYERADAMLAERAKATQ